jgi:hypothetical protein
MSGNSLTNSYRDPSLEHTLRQYPWACSLRTRGFRGRHICGATLLSTPPAATVLVGAAHCNYVCKDTDGRLLETCCCRDPEHNFASCRSTSSYCGSDGRLRLADPADLLVVCGVWSIGEEPELYSREDEVVLPVTKIINHPGYSPEFGPGEGNDIAVYHVDDTLLRDGQVPEGTVLPACLPDPADPAAGSRAIFAPWKDPVPLYAYYGLDFDRSVKRYRADELVLRHSRMEVVECQDPAWMASDTYYPEGVLCARDPSGESCLDTGDSGSGLVAARQDGSYSWLGALSFYRGCDRAALIGGLGGFNRLNFWSGDNPGVFSSGPCHLGWVARQYGLKWHGQAACQASRGSREDGDKTDCATYTGQKCDFASRFPISNFLNNTFLNVEGTSRDIEFTECTLRTLEGHVNLVFQCPLNARTLAPCPNNCLGVRPSAIVAGGTALLAVAAGSGITFLQGMLGIGAMTVSYTMLARESCLGPLYCRARNGQCCLVRGGARGPACTALHCTALHCR